MPEKSIERVLDECWKGATDNPSRGPWDDGYVEGVKAVITCVRAALYTHSGAPQPVALTWEQIARALEVGRAAWGRAVGGSEDEFMAKEVVALYARSGAAEALKPNLPEELTQEKSVQPADERQELERLRNILREVWSSMDEGDGEAPGHSHARKGYWDDTGQKCQWCATWAVVTEIVESKDAARAAMAPKTPAYEPTLQDAIYAQRYRDSLKRAEDPDAPFVP